MLKKKLLLIAVLMLASFVFSAVPAAAETAKATGILVDKQIITEKTPAAYSNNTVLAPAKELLESLGGTFSFDTVSMTARAVQGENELVFFLDESVVMHNGKYIQTPAPMKIINFRFMIPAEFTSERLGAQSYMSTRRNLLMIFKPQDGKLVYNVMSGDSLWIISQLFGTTINAVKQLNGLTGDIIYTGHKLVIKDFIVPKSVIPAHTTNGATIWAGPGFDCPVVNYLSAWTNISVTGKTGNWYRVETPRGNGYTYFTVTGIKQDLSFTPKKSSYFSNFIPVDTSKNSVTHITYTIQTGDYIWRISEKFGIPVHELTKLNGISESTTLYPGQTLKIPVYNIPVKEKTGPEYGEILDWFKEGQYIFPIGKTGKLTDLRTGKSFMIKRTIGVNHSDTETLTVKDTNVMKEIFGGSWNWNKRPFILEVDGRRFAVSVAGMPHAGVDGVPFLQNVNNRSDNWGYGPNYDMISGNGMNGHFDLYFLNSLTHKNNSVDPEHQYNILAAGGLR